MSPPDDTQFLARLGRWSEWWFTPRWRALLTWVALNTIGELLCYRDNSWFHHFTQQPFDYLNSLLPVAFPWYFKSIITWLNEGLLLSWFQPLALRLSFRRGLAWIGSACAANFLLHYLFSRLRNGFWLSSAAPVDVLLYYVFDWQGSLPWILAQGRVPYTCGAVLTALQFCILRGWRSRPWMIFPAQALSLVALWESLPHWTETLDTWLRFSVVAIPIPVLLLYGTRLLRPEERAGGTAAKLTALSRADLPSHRRGS